MIINISDSAKKELNSLFDSYNLDTKFIRIYINKINAWYEPIFSLALDEPCKNDIIFKSDDFNIILNKDLSDKISIINIYYKSAISSDIFRVSTDLVWREEYYGLPWSKPW